MTSQHVAEALLLAVGVGVELLCCIGILAMENVYDRLHYLAPATTLGSAAIVTAVLIQEGMTQPGIKSILIFCALFLAGPVLAHATARAARARHYEDWTVQQDENVKQL
jgi:multicomponent Na+:H+ antiporter subunit G